MRTVVILAALLLAAGCASGSGFAPLGRSGGGLSAADRADPLGALRRVGAGDSITPEGAKALFGAPDVERRDGAGAMLTWRTPTCAVALAFAADRTGTLRLGAASIAGRDQHAPQPPADQCVREAMAHRTS
jgi:hypothetical protein